MSQSTTVQVSTDSGFSTISYTYDDAYTTSVTVPQGSLPTDVPLYIRARHTSDSGTSSAWSSIVQFTVKAPWTGTLTPGTPVACNSHNSDYISTTLLSSDRVLVCYTNNTNSSYLYSLVITG